MGRIFKKPCKVCGDLNVEAHHEDYSKPLDVVWLCHKHHGVVHSHRFNKFKNLLPVDLVKKYEEVVING